MDEFSLDVYNRGLKSAKAQTPENYFEWLSEAGKMVNAQFGDLSAEDRAKLAVQVAGHLSLAFVAEKIDLSLGLIQQACEAIGDR